MHMNPAKSVIEKMGGPTEVARITGKHMTRVYRWMYPRSRGGTDGVVPHEDAKKLLDHAAINSIDLKADDFFACSGAADRSAQSA